MLKTKKEIREWAKNIAYNYNHNIETNLIKMLFEAGKDLKLNIDKIDMKWQYYYLRNTITWQEVEILLLAGLER